MHHNTKLNNVTTVTNMDIKHFNAKEKKSAANVATRNITQAHVKAMNTNV